MSISVIDTLMQEHRLIEKMLFCLTQYVDEMSAGKNVEQKDLEKFTDFLTNYSDRMHHFKEEALLFKAMIDSGFPGEHGPIAVMLSDHEAGREYIKVLTSYTPAQNMIWSESDRQKIAQAARAFSALLSVHIQKEDQILYPMALRVLAGEAQTRLTDAVAIFQSAEADNLKRFEKLSDELFSRYGTGFKPQPNSSGGFSCAGGIF